MSKRKGLAAAAMLAGAIAATISVPARADQYSNEIMGEDHVSGGAMFLDAVVARPVLVVSTGIGGILFLAASPFAMAGGNLEQTWNALVGGPAEQAFSRCLGCTPVQHDRARASRQTELVNAPKN